MTNQINKYFYSIQTIILVVKLSLFRKNYLIFGVDLIITWFAAKDLCYRIAFVILTKISFMFSFLADQIQRQSFRLALIVNDWL
jgi:hypothetical protein